MVSLYPLFKTSNSTLWDFVLNIVSTHTHTHTHMHVCAHTHAYIHMYTQTLIHARTHTHTHTHMHTHTHTHTHTDTHTHTHTHTQTHTNTYIHTRMHNPTTYCQVCHCEVNVSTGVTGQVQILQNALPAGFLAQPQQAAGMCTLLCFHHQHFPTDTPHGPGKPHWPTVTWPVVTSCSCLSVVKKACTSYSLEVYSERERERQREHVCAHLCVCISVCVHVLVHLCVCVFVHYTAFVWHNLCIHSSLRVLSLL